MKATKEEAFRIWMTAYSYALGESILLSLQVIDEHYRKALFEEWWKQRKGA